MKKENKIVVPIYYTEKESGDIEYDFEQMTSDFEQLLSEL